MPNNFTFTKAVKSQEKLRLALDGPAGAGKTWTALTIGTYLAEQTGGRIAVIDSERSSAKKYASYFDFDHLTLPDWSPHTYMDAMRAAIAGGYAVMVVDSLSHAWEGVLELKDQVTARSRTKNSYDAWREATPVHNQLVDIMLRADLHVIATMRTKTEHLVEEGSNGRMKVTKIGTKPIMRDGVEFEFDVVGDIDLEHTMVVSKTRCHEIADAVIRRPGEDLAKTLWDWLNDGEAYVPPPAPPVMASAADIAELTDAAKALTEDQRAVLTAWRIGQGLTIKRGELTAADAVRVMGTIDEILEDEDPDQAGPGEGSGPESDPDGSARHPEHAPPGGDTEEGLEPDDAVDPRDGEDRPTSEPAAPRTAAEVPSDEAGGSDAAGTASDLPPITDIDPDPLADLPQTDGGPGVSTPRKPSARQVDMFGLAVKAFNDETLATAKDRRDHVTAMRHHLIHLVTAGRTDTSWNCTDEELNAVCNALAEIGAGRKILHRSANGTYALRSRGNKRTPASTTSGTAA